MKQFFFDGESPTLQNKIYNYMTSITKKMYIGKLDDIVDKYNITYHSKIKTKSVDVKSRTYTDSSKKLMTSTQNLNFAILPEYRNIKWFLQKAMFQIGMKKFLWLYKLKKINPWTCYQLMLKVKKLLERFTINNCKKQIKKTLELKK